MAAGDGLVTMTPTSVSVTGAGSSATIAADGSVDFTSAETLSLNDVFSSAHDNYLIVIRSTHSVSTNSDINARLRVGGSDATGANYTDQYVLADSTTVSAARETSETSFRCSVTSTTQSGSHTHIYGPFLAQPTAMRLVSAQGTSSARIVDNAATHSLSTSYTGITLIPFIAGSISGNVAVFGYEE